MPEAEESGLRCTHCGVPFHEDSTFDDEGLCEKCQAMPHCRNHSGATASVKCPRCRGAFCPECLLEGSLCTACQAKSTPSTNRSAPAAGSGKSAAKKKAPGPSKTELSKRIPASPPLKNRPPVKGTAPERKKTRSKAKKAAHPAKRRGRAAMDAETRTRYGMWGSMALVLLIAILLLGGFLAHANSPSARRARLTDQMALVQQAAIAFMAKNHRLPETENDLTQSLSALQVPNATRIHLIVGPLSATPETIFYQPQPPGFLIRATDNQGAALKDADGQPLILSQYEDTSRR